MQKNEAMVSLAVEWCSMSEEEKAPYYERAKDINTEYRNKVNLRLVSMYDTNVKTSSKKSHHVNILNTVTVS